MSPKMTVMSLAVGCFIFVSFQTMVDSTQTDEYAKTLSCFLLLFSIKEEIGDVTQKASR
jgi:hypothetical protein